MSATKSNQFTVRVTDDMWLLMEQIIRKEGHRSINERPHVHSGVFGSPAT